MKAGHWILLAGTLMALAAGPAMVQDSGHTSQDPRKCKVCKPALEKALTYTLKNYKSSGLAGHVYAGFLFLIMDYAGDTQFHDELQECVKWCQNAIKTEGFNGNWYLGMCYIFLAEYAVRYPDPAVLKTLQDGLKIAAKNQEETGGWCHHLEMWKKNNYNKIGGGRDLGMVTSMIYGAFLIMKYHLKIDPGVTMEKAHKNLESISDGMGFCYGTDNRWGDICMSRASYVFLGITSSKQMNHPFTTKIINGLKQRYKQVDQGHAFGPLHYFGVAAAMHRLGPAEYQKFFDEWGNKLIAAQKEDGSVDMKSDGGKRADADRFMDPNASTPVFAAILMLQKPGVFLPGQKKPEATAKKEDKPKIATKKEEPKQKPTVGEGPYVPDPAEIVPAQADPAADGGGVQVDEQGNPK